MERYSLTQASPFRSSLLQTPSAPQVTSTLLENAEEESMMDLSESTHEYLQKKPQFVPNQK